MELSAQLRDITVDDPVAILKQIHIRGVTLFGITAGGINLYGAFVESTGTVRHKYECGQGACFCPDHSDNTDDIASK